MRLTRLLSLGSLFVIGTAALGWNPTPLAAAPVSTHYCELNNDPVGDCPFTRPLGFGEYEVLCYGCNYTCEGNPSFPANDGCFYAPSIMECSEVNEECAPDMIIVISG